MEPTDNTSCIFDVTEAPLQLRPHSANIIGSFVTIFIAVISVLGNTAVVVATFWSETLRVQAGNILIVYLSCVDILTGLLVMIPSAISVASDGWKFGYVGCKLHTALNYMFACSSSSDIALISFDRAIAVMFPFQYRAVMRTRNVLLLCCLSFCLSLSVSLLASVPDWNGYNYYEGVCTVNYDDREEMLTPFTCGVTICYFGPAVVIGVCYSMIIFAAKRSERNSQKLFVKRWSKEGNMKKTVKSMVAVAVVYYVCYSPYAVSKEMKIILGKDFPPWYNYMTTIFIFWGSATNPFIYGILRKDYRDAFKKLPKMLLDAFYEFWYR